MWSKDQDRMMLSNGVVSHSPKNTLMVMIMDSIFTHSEQNQWADIACSKMLKHICIQATQIILEFFFSHLICMANWEYRSRINNTPQMAANIQLNMTIQATLWKLHDKFMWIDAFEVHSSPHYWNMLSCWWKIYWMLLERGKHTREQGNWAILENRFFLAWYLICSSQLVRWGRKDEEMTSLSCWNHLLS